jgi:hypothetical protein
MAGRSRRSSVAVAAALAGTALAAAPAANAAARASAVPACPTSGLVVWLDTRGSGAAGSVYYTLELTNLTGRRCSLLGYPEVSAATLGGRRLGSSAGRDPAYAPRRIVLADGASAAATLRVTDAHNFPRASCGPVTAAGLRVEPPGRTGSKVVPFPFLACSRAGPVYLHVRAVR